MAGKHIIKNERGSTSRRPLIWVATPILAISLLMTFLAYTGVTQSAIWKITDTGQLTGQIIEDYPGYPAAKNLKAKLDGKALKIENSGRFTVKGVKAGKHVLVITGEAYELGVYKFSTRAGMNSQEFKACLSPIETGARWMQTKKENRHNDSYFLLHPDEQKRVKRAAYVKIKTDIQNKFRLTISSFKVHSPVSLEKWKHPTTRKIYKDVVALDVDGVVKVDRAGTVKKTWRIFAQKVDSRWLFLTGL